MTVFTSAPLLETLKNYLQFIRKSLLIHLQFPTIKGDIIMNAYALKRTAIPQISGLQETKIKLQNIHVFFDLCR